MTDRHLEALEAAAEAWKLTAYTSRYTRKDFIEDIWKHGVFSLTQLAKICRVTVPTVTRHVRPNGTGGGRFEPDALASIITIRKAYLRKEKITQETINIAVKAGCSVSCVAKLANVPYSALYWASKGY